MDVRRDSQLNPPSPNPMIFTLPDPGFAVNTYSYTLGSTVEDLSLIHI